VTRRELAAFAWSIAAILCAGGAQAADETAAVRQAIKDNYAAYSSFDEQKYRATTTDDFLLLEHGELIGREGDVASMAKPGIGFRRTDQFDFHAVTIERDLAYAVYTLQSEIYDDVKGSRGREWLESAILRRMDGDWKMALLHSTRVSHPSGAKGMKDFATRYTAAWNSQDPASVAAFHNESSSLTINDGAPSVGRAAITEATQAFMREFPDLVVEMAGIDRVGGGYHYRWTLTGTNTGPGGTGRKVRISGYEEWTIGADGLIARSLGHFDAADYDRQLGKAPATP
jgi:ketosteroid isomerase-like protein